MESMPPAWQLGCGRQTLRTMLPPERGKTAQSAPVQRGCVFSRFPRFGKEGSWQLGESLHLQEACHIDGVLPEIRQGVEIIEVGLHERSLDLKISGKIG